MRVQLREGKTHEPELGVGLGLKDRGVVRDRDGDRDGVRDRASSTRSVLGLGIGVGDWGSG